VGVVLLGLAQGDVFEVDFTEFGVSARGFHVFGYGVFHFGSHALDFVHGSLFEVVPSAELLAVAEKHAWGLAGPPFLLGFQNICHVQILVVNFCGGLDQDSVQAVDFRIDSVPDSNSLLELCLNFLGFLLKLLGRLYYPVDRFF
jgi:hypothetical protein